MTDKSEDAPQNKPAGRTGLSFFFLVVLSTILKSIWNTIKGGKDAQTDRSEKFWDMVAIDFDRQTKTGDLEQNHIRMVKNTKKYLRESDRVLDFGCATGNVAFEIVSTVKEVHGIDISAKMIEAARRKAAGQSTGKPDFKQSSLFDEGLMKESYDVILVFNILHFMEDIPKTMQRIHELLKPGGLFISKTPCMGEEKSVLNSLLSLVTKTGIIPPMRFFKIAEMEDWVTGGNFQIVETECLTPTEYFIVAKKG
jgi:2-polyprenyl-3-methyl-5-hydroxy-6-metoxy-1,4-benzoquinol methylase